MNLCRQEEMNGAQSLQNLTSDVDDTTRMGLPRAALHRSASMQSPDCRCQQDTLALPGKLLDHALQHAWPHPPVLLMH
jgi:hypothetical protein